VTLFNDILASFDAALVDDPESTWSFVFYSQGGEGRLLLLPEAPTPSRLRRLRAEADAALILGSLWADTAGKGLLFEVDVARGPALAALEASLKSLGRAFQIRQDDVEEEEEEAPHPYPVLRRLLAGLALASEPWPFVYVPAEPGKGAILELSPEDPDPLVVLSFLLDGRSVFSGRCSFDDQNHLLLEVSEGGDPSAQLRADYAPFFAVFDHFTCLVAPTPAAPTDVEDPAPAAEAPRLPSAADVARLRAVLKGRAAQIQKGETGQFVFFATAADGAPLLILSKPGAAVEASMRRAGAVVSAEGAWRCLVPGGIEFSASPTFDFAPVSAELGIKFRFAKA
jgi:hypothetical protein